MITKLSEDQHDPESIWGVEALDLVQQDEWAQQFWAQVSHEKARNRPLLLLFAPSAERLTLRMVRRIARHGHAQTGAPVFRFGVEEAPIAAAWQDPAPGIYIVHNASRFINLFELLEGMRQRREVKVILTCLTEEKNELAMNYKYMRYTMPAEDPAYCSEVAAHIIADALHGGESDPQLDLLLQNVAEAGLLSVHLPLGLLARSLRQEPVRLLQRLEREPLHTFLHCLGEGRPASRMVRFRGEWLAREVYLNALEGHYPTLSELIARVDPEEQVECRFVLNFLRSLRAKGQEAERARIMQYHAEKINACLQRLRPADSITWRRVELPFKSPVLRRLLFAWLRHLPSMKYRMAGPRPSY